MQGKLWTLVAFTTLGGVAAADVPQPERITESAASRRGVAQAYLVAPSGGELTGEMKFITADPVFGAEPLRFSDLGLFGVSGRYSVLPKLELSAHASFLAKQPSFTDEKPWQSVGFGLRTPLGKRAAVALTGSGGHLIDHAGAWMENALTLQWRKPIASVMTFDVTGGINGLGVTAPKSTSAFVGEVAVTTSALFREPSGHWGSWIGIGYALPVYAHGVDPTTGITIDPQPRLDLRMGTVLSLVRDWDVFAELTVVDRGDLANPATRMPILDGGFDQRQLILGVTRHITGKPRRPNHDDDAMQLSAR